MKTKTLRCFSGIKVKGLFTPLTVTSQKHGAVIFDKGCEGIR